MVTTRSLLLTALLVSTGPLHAQRDYALERFGLEFRPPKGWVELPAAGHRGQLVAMFSAPRVQAPRGGGRPYPPTLRVMFFAGGGSADADEVDGLPRRTRFRDFADYLARGRSTELDLREDQVGTVGEIEARRFVAIEGRDDGDRALLGVVVSQDDGELVIEFELLADHLEKQRKDFDRCLQSVSRIEPSSVAEAAPIAPWRADPAAWQQSDEAAQESARAAFATAMLAAAERPLPGWKVYPSRHWTVVSAADAGATKKAIQAAEAMRVWCEQRFGPVSDREPLPAVLRIFSSPDQYSVFTEREATALEFDPDRRELYFSVDPNLGSTAGYGMLLRAVLWQYLEDEQPGVSTCLPRWLDQGFWEYCRSTQVRGKKIEFESSDVEDGRIRYQQRADTMPAVWSLMQESIQPSPEDGAVEDVWGYTPECARLVRWVLDGGGGEAFDQPELLAGYVRALGQARADWGPDPVADVDRARLNAAQTKALWTVYYPWRDGVLRGTNDRAVPLSVEAWQAVNAKWLAFNEGRR